MSPAKEYAGYDGFQVVGLVRIAFYGIQQFLPRYQQFLGPSTEKFLDGNDQLEFTVIGGEGHVSLRTRHVSGIVFLKQYIYEGGDIGKRVVFEPSQHGA